jgi:hypothetical protein
MACKFVFSDVQILSLFASARLAGLSYVWARGVGWVGIIRGPKRKRALELKFHPWASSGFNK